MGGGIVWVCVIQVSGSTDEQMWNSLPITPSKKGCDKIKKQTARAFPVS